MIRPIFPMMLLFSSFSALAQEVELSIRGISGELEQNVETYLQAIPTEDYSTGLRFQARLEKRLTEALNALGYYHPDFSFEVEADKQLVITIKRGEPVLIALVDIQLNGEARDDQAFKKLIEKSGKDFGSVSQEKMYALWEAAKSKIGWPGYLM